MKKYMIKLRSVAMTLCVLSACAKSMRYVSDKYRGVEGVQVNYFINKDKARSIINFIRQCAASVCDTDSDNHFNWTQER